LSSDTSLSEALRRLLEARHHDPFTVLGRHPCPEGSLIRVLLPGAKAAAVESEQGPLPMSRLGQTDLFEWRGDGKVVPQNYAVLWEETGGTLRRAVDPYHFPPVLPDFDLHLFGEGKHRHAYHLLGARPHSIDGVTGILFATWAPNAERVSVVGDFNHWDGRVHPLRSRGSTGIWELFLPGLTPGTLYKFEIRNRESGAVFLKADPYGRRFELRPATGSIVDGCEPFGWGDQDWLAARAHRDWRHTPMSIYEVHLGSWQRDTDGRFLTYRELAHRLVEYVHAHGFTHIELLPITEHPFDASWGYQTTGYFAPTCRHGTPDDLRYFIDYCHRHGIGVLLDWVPAHFPRDAHGLARFDGSALYEHDDPRRGEHRDWGTLIFNYGRAEVKNFLISSAVFWIEEFHFDGLRVDAVASMLYLDYSRSDGDWVPNMFGGRENLEAIDFMKELNVDLHDRFPGVLVVAEESTAWPKVSRPVWDGGLGFSMKWNMGWMNDTLAFMHREPIHRRYHHDKLTFGLLYAFTENFVLPFSHDEVVHMKRSMLDKMPGDDWQRFANLRLLYTYMFAMPGKKLLFMGSEFAQGREWNSERTLDWELLLVRQHAGVQKLVSDLNRLYRENPQLYRFDFEFNGFEWLDCDDADHSVISFIRKDGASLLVVVLNFTPVPRYGYALPVPRGGWYVEIFNSDSEYYGGTNLGNGQGVRAEDEPYKHRPYTLSLDLPPLGGVVLRPA